MPPRAATTTALEDTPAWQAHWLAEAIRLREEHWGPLEDADAVRQARNGPDTLEDRICCARNGSAAARAWTD